MAGKGGGAWKVAYADFVTAMMAFFLVMWITGQSKAVREAVADYMQDPFGYKSKTQSGGLGMQGGKMPRGAKSAAKGPKARGRGTGPSVGRVVPPEDKEPGAARNAHFMVIHDGTHSSEGTLVLFTESSAELSPQGEKRLKEILPQILGKPNKIEIRGHASRRPMPAGGPFKDTWELCFARCEATLKYLEKAGVESSRIRLSQAAQFEPITIRMGPEQEAQNSRVEVYQLVERVEDFQGSRKEREEQNWTP
jgi:chemotaxis protein MotB